MGRERQDVIRRDFDRIALLSERGWDHNSHYHSALLRKLPEHLDQALDVGCGTGELTRLLALRARKVTGIDLSPEMVRVARERSGGCGNVSYAVGEYMSVRLPREGFDCIAAVATAHHMNVEAFLCRACDLLAPGGVLLVLDLYRAATPLDLLLCAAAVPVNLILRLRHAGALRRSAALRGAWREHGRHDVVPRLREVRQACRRCLPGGAVRRHLLWRYSLVWRKPGLHGAP